MTNQNNRDALIAHIHAQDTIIRSRNYEIAELQRQLTAALEKPFDVTAAVEKRCKSYYRAGWKDAYKAIKKHIDNQRNDLLEFSTPPLEGEQE
jgi:hypothetical protein